MMTDTTTIAATATPADETKDARAKRLKAEANARYRAKKAAAANSPTPTATARPAKVTATAPLTERAMLVSLSIGHWLGEKKNNEKSNEITNTARAEKGSAKLTVQLIPKAKAAMLVRARHHARDNVHLKYTLPWSDDGTRILPATMYLDYMAEMRKAETNFRGVVAAFLAEYPQLVADAQTRLGSLFRASDFPTVEQIKDKYPWSMKVTPLPTAGDFRVDLGNEANDEIKAQIEENVKNSMESAMFDLWERMYGAVGRIVERLSDEKGVFRDSLIGNVTELCGLLDKMNVTGDANLKETVEAVRNKLTKAEPENLRKNKTARADTAKSANDILKAMAAFMPGLAAQDDE